MIYFFHFIIFFLSIKVDEKKKKVSEELSFVRKGRNALNDSEIVITLMLVRLSLLLRLINITVPMQIGGGCFQLYDAIVKKKTELWCFYSVGSYFVMQP